MSSESRKDNTENIITSPDNAPVERKDKYLKRLAKEKKANKKNYAKSGKYITLNGYKVLIKFQNATGSVYTQYWFNAKRFPEKMAEIKKAKGFEIDGEFVEFR